MKQIISLYKSLLRPATSNEDPAKIVDPFLCLNISCPPGSYDVNVEPAKDDVLFANSELLLGVVERFFRSIYGDVQPAPSKSSMKNVSALKPHGIEMLLARKEAPSDSTPVRIAPVVGSTLPLPRSSSQLSIHTQPHSSLLTGSALDSSPAVPHRQTRSELTGVIGRSNEKLSATGETQAEAYPGLLPSPDSPTSFSTESTGLEPSYSAVPVEGKPGWKNSMYSEDEDNEADLEVHLQGLPRSPIGLDLDGDKYLQDVNVSNPWAFAKINAAMRSSGRNKQLHTPGREIGDAGHATYPSSGDRSQQAGSPLLNKLLPRVHPAHSSPEADYPTPSPFPFPQKARGKRKVDDAGVDALSTAASSNKERQKHGALDTWVQKSLGGYDELDESPNTLQEDPGPPDLPYSCSFTSARSLPLGGIPLSEIPDTTQRQRRKPAPRKHHQGTINEPCVPPVNDPNRVWFDIGETPSQKRPRKPRPNNDRQVTAVAPTLILRNDELENDNESVNSASTERLLPPIHPDLAITLDYEARKQIAGDAHRKALREQAAAANLIKKPQSATPNPFHPPQTTSSPHKNRQAKAIAALRTPLDTPPWSATPSPGAAEETAALEPSDPRAYLLRIHRRGDQAPEALRVKSRRHKTTMLPFERVMEDTYMGDLTLVIEDVNVGDVEEDMRESGAWDRYVRSGKEVGEVFGEVEDIERWKGRLRDLVRATYVVEGGDGERADVNVDLSKILRAHHAAGNA